MTKTGAKPIFQAEFPKLVVSADVMDKFKMPNFDVFALMEIQRKNMEMLTTINQASFDGMQSIVHSQADLIRQTIEDATSLMDAVRSAQTPQEKLICQAEAAKVAVEKCVANINSVTDRLVSCNSQALKTFSSRVNDSFEEFRALVKPDVA